jgi:hypothetical protein
VENLFFYYRGEVQKSSSSSSLGEAVCKETLSNMPLIRYKLMCITQRERRFQVLSRKKTISVGDIAVLITVLSM